MIEVNPLPLRCTCRDVKEAMLCGHSLMVGFYPCIAEPGPFNRTQEGAAASPTFAGSLSGGVTGQGADMSRATVTGAGPGSPPGPAAGFHPPFVGDQQSLERYRQWVIETNGLPA